MSFYTPNTTVYLCNVPINSNQKNQFVPYTSGNSVWNAEGQRNWFLNQNHLKHSFNDFTYQRKDNIIRVPVNAEVLFADGSNYVVYQNQHYNGKWFYCFITKIEFINENMTALHIKTDVFQTWFFEFYKSNHMDINFISRETVIKDEMFKHTLPEPLPTPEYKTENGGETPSYQIRLTPDLNAKDENEFNNNYWCAVFMTEKLDELSSNIVNMCKYIGGNPCACYLYGMSTDVLPSFFNVVSSSGKINSVVSCVSIPKSMVDFHPLSINPNPPEPPLPPITENFLGSPYASPFYVTQIYNVPTHYGIDLDNNDNLNLYATTSGKVIASLEHPSFGKMVIIQSSNYSPTQQGNYYYFMYCHMDTLTVQTGASINRGDHIGTQGDTGSSWGSHCHYEVQIHGDISPLTTATEVGNIFGHDVISLSQSVNPTIFTNFPNVEGYYE